MISLKDYVGIHALSPDWTTQRRVNAAQLMDACDKLELLAIEDGVKFEINPKTKSEVSGEIYGGFRPQNCLIGAPKSAHKEGLAVDRYDPHGAIDAWCMAHVKELEQCAIYLEHPDATPHWSHWQVRPTKNRIFKP